MQQKQIPIETTIALSYIYGKIKKQTRGDIIELRNLKIILTHTILCKKQEGGNTKGIPYTYLHDVIKDMINFKLLERIDHHRFRILKSKCTNRLKKFPF